MEIVRQFQEWLADLMSLELLGIVAATGIAVFTVQTATYVRRSEFEDIYIQRYWEILSRIPVDLRVQLIEEKELRDVLVEDSNVEQALWDYLALCEDEIDLRKIGRVTDETWAVWCHSIEDSIGGYPHRPMLEHVMEKFGVTADQLRCSDPTDREALKHLPFDNLRHIYLLQSQGNAHRVDPKKWPTKEAGVLSWASGRRMKLFGRLKAYS